MDHSKDKPRPWSLLIALGLIVLYGASRKDGLFGQTVAAWVQGVGSIGAIIFAWAQGSAAWRREEARRRKERDLFMTDIATLAGAAHQTAFAIRQCFVDDDFEAVNEHLRNAEEFIVEFAKFYELPIDRWPSSSLAVSLAGYGAQFRGVIGQVRKIQGAALAGSNKAALLDGSLNGLVARLQRLNNLAEIAGRR